MSLDFSIDWPLVPIDALVPHRGPMSLLDRVLHCEGDELEAEVTVAHGPLFKSSQSDGLGAWIGIEYMAQAVAAWAGAQGLAQGAEPGIGLLLGCRRYRSTQSRFTAGDMLRVKVRREFQADNGLGQFACSLLKGDDEVAQAQLTVFAPKNPEEFLKQSLKQSEQHE